MSEGTSERERKYKNCERILAAININSAQKKFHFHNDLM